MRKVGSGVCIFIGALLLFHANLLVWLDLTVFNSHEFTSAVDDALDRPDVQKRLADVLAQQAVESGTVQEQVDSRLPPNLAFAAPLIDSQLQTLLSETTQRLLATELVGGLRDAVIRNLHAQLIAILEDDKTVLSVQGDALVIDLHDLLLRLFDRLGIPPPQRLVQSDAGRIVILDDTSGLRQASFFVQHRQAITFAALLGSLAFLGLGIAVSRGREGAALACGYAVIGVALVTLLLLLGLNWGLESGAEERVVLRALISAFETNLKTQCILLLIVGVGVVIAADSRLRAGVSGLAHSASQRLATYEVGRGLWLVAAAAALLLLLWLL